jgi:protein-S-isoprenylcysteine O-methyltransferase Ste14
LTRAIYWRLMPIHLAYCLIAFFFVAERLLRQGANARSMDEGCEDRGSTRAIGAAFGTAILCLAVAPLLNRLHIGRVIGEKWAWGGVTVMAGGLALRIWASRVLGAYYTRTLRTDEGQHLVTAGPYRLVRHPGYLGVLLLWLGAGIATENGLITAATGVRLIAAYRYRIRVEERMLAEAFPEEFQRHARRTWRLIPFIY